MKKLIPLLLIPLVLAGCSGGISSDEAKDRVENFINNTLMAGAPIQATVTGVTKENGLFKIVVDAGGQTVDSYLTADGSLFFPQAMNIAEIEAQAAALGDITPPTPPVDVEVMEEDGEAMEEDGEAMEEDGEAMEEDGDAMEEVTE